MRLFFKSLLISITLLLVDASSQAQHYQSIFGKQTTSWVFRWNNLPGEHQDTVFADTDTIVNNLNYKKLVVSTYAPYSIGLLREDTIVGKVWYKSLDYFIFGVPDPNDTIERLAFDYSLVKGDTFDVSNVNIGYPGSYPHSWNIVDSVYYINGRKHIQFDAPNPPQEPITLIEGIGGNYGIIWKHYSGFFMGHYLLCSYKNGVRTDYVNKRYNGNCYLNSQVGLEEELKKTKIEIYPNPFQNYFQIQVPEGRQVKQVAILDAGGNQMLSFQNPDADLPVQVGKLPPGFYMVMVFLNDDSVSVHKLFK